MNRSRFMCSLYNERPSLLDQGVYLVKQFNSLLNRVGYDDHSTSFADLPDPVVLNLAGVVTWHLRLTPHRDTTVGPCNIGNAGCLELRAVYLETKGTARFPSLHDLGGQFRLRLLSHVTS